MEPVPPKARKIAVVGAGGVGGLLGALLVRAGHEVAMLARGAALAAIRAHGLRVSGPDGELVAPIAHASDHAAALGAADLVLVTVKTWQLAELGPQLAPLIGPGTAVIPVQNGVEACELLAAALGDDHVLGCTARMLSWIERPGEIRWIGARPSLTIGARRPGQAAAVRDAIAALAPAGIDVQASDAIEQARWIKFQFIVPFGAVGAVERAPLGQVRSQPATRARLEAVMHEIAALAAARGVTLPPGAAGDALARLDALPADATSSMHRDVVEGRPSELDELIGAVVRLGAQAGVATPVSAALYAALEPLERAARGTGPR